MLLGQRVGDHRFFVIADEIEKLRFPSKLDNLYLLF